jgi:LPPG:FO 2-phospho-L-lactate transferase
VSALGVARLYVGLLDVLCVDDADRDLAPAIRDLGFDVLVTGTVMGGADDRRRLAGEVLDAAVRG